MPANQQVSGKIKIGFKQALGLVGPYVKKRFLDQIKAVSLIIIYLIFFQTIVLGIPIADAMTIALGMSLVIIGLTFFMEGLLLGLMPLGEVIGVILPQKSKLPVILVFAFILGMSATFAEPAIGVLKEAGSSVKPWDAPLLFLLLNKHADILVYAVGGGVGLAVIFGMLRFLYNWSLKPFIYGLVLILTTMTIWGYLDNNIRQLTGLAWDCGAVTTGPVTVPLVLALGIGICRMVGSSDSGSAGFGIVTLASLFPILTVFLLGLFFLKEVPQPNDKTFFFSTENRGQAEVLFENQESMKGYALLNSSFSSSTMEDMEEKKLQPVQALFDDDMDQVLNYIKKLMKDDGLREEVLGSREALESWAALKGNKRQRMAVFGDSLRVKEAVEKYSRGGGNPPAMAGDIMMRNGIAAVRAILPLTLLLMFFLAVILREKIPRIDEILLGVLFGLIGMGIFNIGIELGLTKLGKQVGSKLPSSFTAIELKEERHTINNFDKNLLMKSITNKGQERFFYSKIENEYKAIPYRERDFDPVTKQYSYTPMHGPLFGSNMGLSGIMVVLLFAFIMGYGATLAEPALNALGLKVEELTVGTFRKSLLMQAVAVGVGIGIALGVAKIIWNIPLVYMLAPPYLLLMFITFFSTEEFVNIGWDSAGVTTGPITVPLVLAMGLGISSQVPGVVEGFGILSMASVSPILSVLIVGLNITKKRRAALKEAEGKPEKQI